MRSLDLEIPRQKPRKRPASERRRDFNEIDHGFTLAQAMLEARRCVQCAHPPCSLFGCPVSHRIPEWINHIAEGRLREAWRVISLRNNLPESCGKLCPQEVLCESRCVVRHVGEPVAIGKLEEFVARTARQQGWTREAAGPAAERSGRRVAIVGTGPAGLAAAEELLARGHEVVLFERQKCAGGLLVYGIPNFKYSKERMKEWVERLRTRGAEFRCGVEVGGGGMALGSLLEEAGGGFDAVVLATGAEAGRRLNVPGRDLENIHLASDFLIAANLDAAYVEHPPVRIEPRGVCAIFGAGDTAMDCVRTAARLGYERVMCVYRRSEAEMTGRVEDRGNAAQEGVEFRYLEAPVRFLGEGGRVTGVECVRMRLGEPDASGRRRPEPVEGSEFVLPADTVVLALGYGVDPRLAESAGLALEDGAVRVDERGMTSRAGLFAAGDAVNGADLIVTAIKSGRQAARGVHAYLTSMSPAQ